MASPPHILGDKLHKAFDQLNLGIKKHKRSDDGIRDDVEKKDSLDKAFKRRIRQAKSKAHRLRDVFAAPLNFVADFVPPSHSKSPEDDAFIRDALKDSFVFQNMTKAQKKDIVGAFEFRGASRDERIIRQGDKGDYFYVLQEGSVQFVVDGKAVGSASPGDTFGELALFYDCPRAATCLAETPCRLWRLDQGTFRKAVAAFTMKADNETKTLLKTVPFMKDMDDKQLTRVAQAMFTETYKKGDIIVHKGDEAKTFFVIKEGSVKATDIEIGGSKYDDIVLKAGDHFGDLAITSNTPAKGNCVALENTTLLCMPKQRFTKLFGDIRTVGAHILDKKALEAIPFPGYDKLEKDEIEALSSFIVECEYRKGHLFFAEGLKTSPVLFMIRSGSVAVNASKIGLGGFEWLGFALGLGETKTITAGGFFGNDNISPDGGLPVAKYSVTAETDCAVGV